LSAISAHCDAYERRVTSRNNAQFSLNSLRRALHGARCHKPSVIPEKLLMRVEAKLGLVTLFVLGIAASCGGRAEPEFDEDTDASSVGGSGGSAGTGGHDASTDSPGADVSVDASEDSSLDAKEDTHTGKDSSSDAKPSKDAATDSKDIFDAFPLPDSGPVGECVSCLKTNCDSQINACYNNTACWQGVQCAAQKCLNTGGTGGSGGGGQVDMQCMLGCFNNDVSSAMQAYGAFQCVTGSCGTECGMNGSGGSGGGTGGSSGGGTGGSSGSAGSSGGGGFGGGLGAIEGPAYKNSYYIGTVRIPEPEEVALAYPWFADVLEGRTPNPLPPSANK
jgi:hypothetical protein